MREGTPQILSLKRTLAMLDAVVADGGRSSVSELARRTGLPVATAHRQIATLVAERYLAPAGGGRHIAGPRLRDLLHLLDEKQLLANVAAPVLHRLAGRVRSVVQLGTLENDMVTYRIKTGRGATDLFTRVGMQLEAYCSGIGKVLLAHLPEEQREAYLAGGPFVALTERTIVDPDRMREELERVRQRGFAVDDQEIAPELRCIAVPLRNERGEVLAAISASQDLKSRRNFEDFRLIELLKDSAQQIELTAARGESAVALIENATASAT